MSDAAFKILALWCLAWLGCAECSVLVPTYVLPPASFKQQRDQRSLPASQGLRTLARLAGGHLRLPSTNSTNKIPGEHKNYADYSKNSFAYVDKEVKNYDDKFAGVVVKTENQNVGWNQGQWDDGMLMSSAGNGKEKNKQKGAATADDDDDKKTLADQVAEGKYGLIQKELFSKMPVRPGVISYATNSETKGKDNEASLGGLKNEEIWLAEDHLLVLKGGSYQEHSAKPNDGPVAWPPIDAYQAPPRQVKIPQNREVPPPFPVRLSDNGPLVFLTPNGSIPAPLFPARPPGASFGAFPPPPFSYPSASPSSPQGPYPPNIASGGAPFPIAPFPFLPPRNESELPFPFPGPINSSFPGGLPPGASFLPPPGNLSDLYDEDDPSIYYPPPYSFFYQADNTSKVPAGPLVPGIVLPPPPDFFAPLETPTTASRPTAHAYPPTPASPATSVVKPYSTKEYLPPAEKPRDSDNTIDTITSAPPKTVTLRPVQKGPKVVVISKPVSTRKPHTTVTTIKPYKVADKHTSPISTVSYKQIKTTLKPIAGSIANAYYPDKVNPVVQSPRPFLIYGPPEKSPYDKTYVTSTPIPLRSYYSNTDYQNQSPQVQLIKQNPTSITRIRPDFLQNVKQNGKSVASFYFYEEPVPKSPTPTVGTYDGRNYYQPLNGNGQVLQDDLSYNSQVENDYTTTSNLDFRQVPSREPSPFFFIPHRQGSRTLTQEYFSVQKPKLQNNYVQQVVIPQQQQQQQNRPESFYDQIANIQQTIDYYTTNRPKVNIYQQVPYREARQKLKPTPRPVYQFSYQSNNIRPEQNTFRAPQMDNEPFRPMVTYSKPYNNQENGQSTPKTVFTIEKGTTESPQPSKYYTTTKTTDYDYEDDNQDKNPYIKTSVKHLSNVKQNPSTVSPKVKKGRLQYPTTKNPIDHAYYTKQEERLFDDITKNYFTIFGQKIESGNNDELGIAVTSPIRPYEVSTANPPLNRVNNKYNDKSNSIPIRNDQQPIISLASDTQVNYRQPRPLINPDSEFIPIVDPVIQAKYNAEQNYKRFRDQIIQKPKVHNVEIIKAEEYEQKETEGQEFARDQIDILRPIAPNRLIQSLQSDLNVKYGNNLNIRGRPQVGEGRPGSLVAYRLPGEGAHVYFLTPQPARHEYRSAESIEQLS